MKKFKYILMLIISLGLFNSCVDDTTTYDQNASGNNLAGFLVTSTSAATVCDDAEHAMAFKVKVSGPTVLDLKNDITLTISADPALIAAAVAADTNLVPAVLGTHYRIDNPSVVLKASNNYLGYWSFEMLTAGIVPPLKKTPVLVLTAAATGDGKVVGNGKPLVVKLSYACYSNLAGTYNVHMVMTRAISGAVTSYDWTEDITQTGVGEYRTSNIAEPGWVGGVGTPGFTFYDNCGVTTVPEQNLLDYYSNIVVGLAPGTCSTALGTIHLEYSVSTTAAAGYRNCVCDYVRVP
jgi:hypothetical protein